MCHSLACIFLCLCVDQALCVFLSIPFQFSSVQSLSFLTLCNPMNHSTPGLPVHQKLPEFTQTHAHRVGDAIQPSHPLSSPLLLPPIPPSIRVFSNESTLRMRWPKYWSFSFSISPSSDHPGLISFSILYTSTRASQVALMMKSLLANAGRCKRHRFNPWVGKIPLEECMATHSNILAWRIPWTEEPDRL